MSFLEANMTKAGLLVLLVIAALPAAAQTRITGKQTCPKPDPSYSVDAGDQAGHTMMLQKATCTWDTPVEIAGAKATTSIDVASSEAWGMKASQHGYNIATMDNGDKFTVRFTGGMTAAKDGSATFEGKWTFVSGTGKLKGIKGSGTYKGSGTADGAGTIEVEGDYTLPSTSK
jgi:uncharacterized protein GlcG (DUF336 family)